MVSCSCESAHFLIHVHVSRNQLMLTCSIGYPHHHHHHPRPCEPGRQPSITTSHSACFHLYSAPHSCRRRRGDVVNTLPGAAVLRSHCHGKAIIGAAGERCTPPGQPRYPAALVHTHLHQINACPLILAGPFITFLSASVQPQNWSPANREGRQHRIPPPPAPRRFVRGENTRAAAGTTPRSPIQHR